MPYVDCPSCGKPLHEERPLGFFRGLLWCFALSAALYLPAIAIRCIVGR